MAYEKKTWVDVPDPSQLTDEQRNSYPRFDAANMNRIEDGIEGHEQDKILHNKSSDGGAFGVDATATKGGAVGSTAKTTNGGAVGYKAISGAGGAIGEIASSNSGGASGYLATAHNGGAVGEEAKSNNGGAIGYKAKTQNGCAVGHLAKTVNQDGVAIDAVQLGTGTNTEEKSMNVYGYKLMKSNGLIPIERMSISLEGVVLWENASPTSVFAGQTIAIDTKPYKRFSILAVSSTYGNHYEERTYSKKNVKYYLMQTFGTSDFSRTVMITDSGVQFFDGYYDSTGDKNSIAIPIKIVGYKY